MKKLKGIFSKNHIPKQAGSTFTSPQGTTMHEHDVNISCHSDDIDWVETHMLPVLSGLLNLRCYLYERDKPAGQLPLESLRESVEQSQHTLLCFSKKYFASSFNNYELLMAHFLDPAGQKNRILPISIDGCRPPVKYRSFFTLRWPQDSSSVVVQKRRLQLRNFWTSLLRSIQCGDDVLESVLTEICAWEI